MRYVERNKMPFKTRDPRLLRASGWCFIGTVIIACVWLLTGCAAAPVQVHYGQVYGVAGTGSMEPYLSSRDAVLPIAYPYALLRPKDRVLFDDGRGRLVAHLLGQKAGGEWSTYSLAGGRDPDLMSEANYRGIWIKFSHP